MVLFLWVSFVVRAALVALRRRRRQAQSQIHPYLLPVCSFRDLQRKQESRARKLLKSMAANASSALLRLVAWLLLRLLRFPFDSVVYHEGQLHLIREALQNEVGPSCLLFYATMY